MALFEYDNQLKPQNMITIDDIGQCALECYNEEGVYFYLLIRTKMGVTTIVTCGPVVPDVNLIPSGFQTTLKRYEFNEGKITKDINLFLNDKKKIISAKEIPYEDAIECIRDMKEYLKNGGN